MPEEKDDFLEDIKGSFLVLDKYLSENPDSKDLLWKLLSFDPATSKYEDIFSNIEVIFGIDIKDALKLLFEKAKDVIELLDTVDLRNRQYIFTLFSTFSEKLSIIYILEQVGPLALLKVNDFFNDEFIELNLHRADGEQFLIKLEDENLFSFMLYIYHTYTKSLVLHK